MCEHRPKEGGRVSRRRRMFLTFQLPCIAIQPPGGGISSLPSLAVGDQTMMHLDKLRWNLILLGERSVAIRHEIRPPEYAKMTDRAPCQVGIASEHMRDASDCVLSRVRCPARRQSLAFPGHHSS